MLRCQAILGYEGLDFFPDLQGFEWLLNKVPVRLHRYTFREWGNRTMQLANALNRAGVKELAIGDFKLANAEVVVAHVSRDILLSKSASESNAGVLGQEYLSSNFAVLDMGGLALYLRHPDSAR